MSRSAPDSNNPHGDNGGTLERVQSFLRALVARGWFDAHVLQSLRAVSAAEGTLVCELTVAEEMCNAMGSLHGGCAGEQASTVGVNGACAGIGQARASIAAFLLNAEGTAP
eukprot:355827-Chlamydomonas_euryale.AAC.10